MPGKIESELTKLVRAHVQVVRQGAPDRNAVQPLAIAPAEANTVTITVTTALLSELFRLLMSASPPG